uniref:Uncharacterized protein n=1 Tax=Arundo donax TaxID=35708 RepID=A0A0A9HQX5_ARUDO
MYQGQFKHMELIRQVEALVPSKFQYISYK